MEHHRAIAIGGSTGAIEALRTICANLPADLPAAVFIVVHVGAEGRNLLAGILDRLCPLPVQSTPTAMAAETALAGFAAA